MEIHKIISDMTIEEKIGQLVACSFEDDTVTPEIEIAIQQIRVGILRYCPNAKFDNFSNVIGKPNRNLKPKETAILTNQLQKLAQASRTKIPLIISLDQEGGICSDMNRGGMTIFPSHMGFGAIGSDEDAFMAGEITGRELRAVGVILNQCPVLDVVRYGSDTVVDTLSFGESTELVSRLGVALMKGFQAGGVASMVKHFPSYGAVTTDAHKELPIIAKNQKDLEQEDIMPYIKVFSAGADAVMMGHIAVTCLDSTNTPASLSEPIIKNVIRGKLNFNGIVQTDALRMGAIMNTYGPAKASVMAIKAGADIVLLRGSFSFFQEGYKALIHAVRQGEISELRLNESVDRILRMKAKLGLFTNPFVNEEEAEAKVGTKENRDACLRLARKSITLVRNRASILPLKPLSSNCILVISPKLQRLVVANDSTQSDEMLTRAIAEYHPNTKGHCFTLNPTEKEVQKMKGLAEKADIVIIGTYNARKNRGQPKLVLELLSTGKPVVIVALDSPYDLLEFPNIDTYLCSYCFADASMKAVAEVIFGKIKPSGKLPVTLPGLYPVGHGLM